MIITPSIKTEAVLLLRIIDFVIGSTFSCQFHFLILFFLNYYSKLTIELDYFFIKNSKNNFNIILVIVC